MEEIPEKRCDVQLHTITGGTTGRVALAAYARHVNISTVRLPKRSMPVCETFDERRSEIDHLTHEMGLPATELVVLQLELKEVAELVGHNPQFDELRVVGKSD